MKLVIQRVSDAEVRVKDNIVGKIGSGLFVLFGVGKNDTKEIAQRFAEKLLKLRIMSDNNDKMNLSIKDSKSEILVVSQFTLYADTSGGNRPSFINAADPTKAREIYDYFIETLRKEVERVETGSFGEYMKIKTLLDGPVTIVIEQ